MIRLLSITLLVLLFCMDFPAPSSGDAPGSPRFLRNADGVITDSGTGLQWLEGPDSPSSWENARDWVTGLGQGWRLPTLLELQGIYLPDSTRRGIYGDPLCLDPVFLRDGGYSLWSVERFPGTAWLFDFSRGYGHWLDCYFPGRFDRAVAVRDGDPGMDFRGSDGADSEDVVAGTILRDYYQEHPAPPFHSTTLQEFAPVQMTADGLPVDAPWRLETMPSRWTWRVPFAGKPGHPAGHEGIDFVHNDPAIPHVPVVAAAAGTIAYVRTGCPQSSMFKHNTSLREAGAGWGNHLVLYHGRGIYTRYAHLAPGSVHGRVGDRVEAGERIGEMGNSGRSETRHLHFELGYHDRYFQAAKAAQSFSSVVNPQGYLPTVRSMPVQADVAVVPATGFEGALPGILADEAMLFGVFDDQSVLKAGFILKRTMSAEGSGWRGYFLDPQTAELIRSEGDLHKALWHGGELPDLVFVGDVLSVFRDGDGDLEFLLQDPTDQTGYPVVLSSASGLIRYPRRENHSTVSLTEMTIPARGLVINRPLLDEWFAEWSPEQDCR